MDLTNISSLPHAHRCPCGTTWAHDPEKTMELALQVGPFLAQATHDKAHTCPKCGEKVWAVLQASQAENCSVWNGIDKPSKPQTLKIRKVK